MDHPIISPKKLIEVALPLDAINKAAAYEKMPGIGPHPRGLHQWWARRPLAAARAVIFSQLVNDPEDLWRCQNLGKAPNRQVKGHWTKARTRLFTIIEQLIAWPNTNNESLLEQARDEIRSSWKDICDLNREHPKAEELFRYNCPPGLYDPFAGGGAIPLEAMRLGMTAYASDLNPVAVMINKAMIEIPTRFEVTAPVSPELRKGDRLFERRFTTSTEAIAEDVRQYGRWMRDEAFRRIGALYPPVRVTQDQTIGRPDLKPYVGQNLNVIAWLWARTVPSPNPAFSHVAVPLVSTFLLSSKSGKEAYISPRVEGDSYNFEVMIGKPPIEAKNGTKAARANFRCLLSGAPIDTAYIRSEACAGRMGKRLMAVVVEGKRERTYVAGTREMEELALSAKPRWRPELRVTTPSHDVDRLPMYGMATWADSFTERQLVALTTLTDLVSEVRTKVQMDAINAGMENDGAGLNQNGTGATAYAEAISVYLAFAIDRCADYSNTCTLWAPTNQKVMHVFGKQAIGMTWDFPEAGILHETVGGFVPAAEFISDCIRKLYSRGKGVVRQQDAMTTEMAISNVVSTDPPYYDNVGYADLSDFFYVWLRPALRDVFPDVFATVAVPKGEELIAASHRHTKKSNAEAFFLDGMTKVMERLAAQAHPAFPVTIYYAFKQSEKNIDSDTTSSGWATFLSAVIRAGFCISGSWPMRTEQEHRMIGQGTNSLASSIVLVCRQRASDAGVISRRQFVRMINESLPLALDAMTRESEDLHSPVAPVDLSQAIIGPGMAIFSRYDAVLEADGNPMTVKTALQLINRFLAEDDFDADTQFCLHWFEQYGWETGKFGEADVLARSKGTSVDGVKQAGVLHAAGGNVRLLKWAEYPSDWDPQADQRLPIWEVLHQLIRVFNTDGETGAAAVFAAVQSKAEAARQLAYRLYTLCERNNWAEDARAYNEVVTSWSGIEAAAAKEPAPIQRTLFE